MAGWKVPQKAVNWVAHWGDLTVASMEHKLVGKTGLPLGSRTVE